MGSTPIESTPAGGNSCGAHHYGALNAPGNANPQGRAEGQRPDDAVYRVSTLDVKWVQHKAPELQPISGWLGSRADEGRAKLR